MVRLDFFFYHKNTLETTAPRLTVRLHKVFMIYILVFNAKCSGRSKPNCHSVLGIHVFNKFD